MRLVNAELLKLRRRTGLVLATFGLTFLPALLMQIIDGGAGGGLQTFANRFGIVALLTVVAGILVGAVVGTADESSGVFRELVVTGRSRLDLFFARVPAGLALVLLAAAAGFALVAVAGVSSPGAMPSTRLKLGTVAPSGWLLLQCAGWLALVAATSYALALGVAAVVGSPGQSIAILLALWLIVTPFVQNVESLEWLAGWILISGLDRVMPDALTTGDPRHALSLVAAVALLLAWTVVPLLAGAWRTMTRDA